MNRGRIGQDNSGSQGPVTGKRDQCQLMTLFGKIWSWDISPDHILETSEVNQFLPDSCRFFEASCLHRSLSAYRSFRYFCQLMDPLDRKRNRITVGIAYRCISHPKRPYRQRWYCFGQKLLLRDVMAGLAKSLGFKVESLDFWRAIKPGETVSDECYHPSALALLIPA